MTVPRPRFPLVNSPCSFRSSRFEFSAPFWFASPAGRRRRRERLRFLLVYGVFFTVATTAVSVRVLGSSNCYLYSFLRALLFAASVAAEVAAALHIFPKTTLARDGAIFTVFHLVLVYLLAWSPWRRR